MSVHGMWVCQAEWLWTCSSVVCVDVMSHRVYISLDIGWGWPNHCLSVLEAAVGCDRVWPDCLKKKKAALGLCCIVTVVSVVKLDLEPCPVPQHYQRINFTDVTLHVGPQSCFIHKAQVSFHLPMRQYTSMACNNKSLQLWSLIWEQTKSHQYHCEW